MIPKVKHPVSVADFRPIVCCSALYKIISKILCSWLKLVLPFMISPFQGAFIESRQIFHNILIVQDLARLYKKKGNKINYMMKIDLRKAYDSVSWAFLDEMLDYL